MAPLGKVCMKISPAIAIAIFLTFTFVSRAMSAEFELTWEWPADRAAEQILLIKILDVKSQSTGLLGFGKTPSFAGNFPDPVILKMELLSKEHDLKGKTVELALPKLELGSLKANDHAALGVLDGNVCICIKRVEADTDIENLSCP